MPDFVEFLASQGIAFRRDVPLSCHTTFRIGGNARLCVFPADEAQLQAAVTHLFHHGQPFFVVGRGSNLLAPDEEVEYPLVFTEKMDTLTLSDRGILAGAGVSLAKLSLFAAQHHLAGLEFLHGIPGSVGGGVRMNAGAYGGEISQLVTQSRFVDPQGRLQTRRGEEHAFSYRHSAYTDGEVLCCAFFSASPGDPAEISAKIRDLDARRREKQPLDYPSAGSTFKRPEGYFAGKLIEDCGLKGYRVGDAMVSEKHAGFCINCGKATSADMRRLIAHIQETVFARFGVRLEPEVCFLPPKLP